MRNAGKGDLIPQAIEGHPNCHRPHSDAVCRVRDSEERHSSPANAAEFAQILFGKAASVKIRHHQQAGRPAVVAVELSMDGEFHTGLGRKIGFGVSESDL